jgi:hypothetical protein
LRGALETRQFELRVDRSAAAPWTKLIDGKEAVTFLVRVKEPLEDPARLVLGGN